MSDAQIKELCLDLMRANTEGDIVQILKEAGFWDMQAYWRYYGDRETNFNSAGNQQAKPDSALVEMLCLSRIWKIAPLGLVLPERRFHHEQRTSSPCVGSA